MSIAVKENGVILIGIVFALVSCSIREKGNLVAENLSVKCTYMMYACGECYKQYRIDTIYDTNRQELTHLIGLDVYVNYRNVTEGDVLKRVEDCITCYDFILMGDLKVISKEEYILYVDSFKLNPKVEVGLKGSK